MLENNVRAQKLFVRRKQRKWFFEIIINERIGREEFLNKLLKDGAENDLYLLSDFPELSVPLVRHYLSQVDQSVLISPENRASFLRYEPLTTEIFNEFLSLFQQIMMNKLKMFFNGFKNDLLMNN